MVKRSIPSAGSALTLLCVLWLPTEAAAASQDVTIEPLGLTIQLPEGWVDLSPGSEARRAMPPEQLPPGTEGASVLAFDMEGATATFASNLNVRVSPCPPIDEDVVKTIARSAQEAIGSSAELVPLEQRVVHIENVATARFDQTLKMPGVPELRQLQYWLPAGERCAVATYTAAVDEWDSYVSVFDRSAQATRGLEASVSESAWERIAREGLSGGMRGAVLGGAVGLIVGLFAWFKRRRARALEDDA